MLHGDAWVELVGVFAVAQEEHIAHQRHQCLCHVLAVLVGIFKCRLNLALGVVFGFEAIHVVVGGEQVFLADFRCALTECAFKHPVGDEGFEHVVLEVEAVACNFLACHAEGWRELAEYAIHGINRNFPNAEEAQHVVDAVGVEILRHLAEALFPPQAAIGYHPSCRWGIPSSDHWRRTHRVVSRLGR